MIQATDLTATRPEQKAFAEREYVDMDRACRILGVSWSMLNRMCSQGYLILVDFRHRGRKRVHYGSLVGHCCRLREEYAIPDRRPVLASDLLRHRDEDILPFALRDTIDTSNAARLLGFQAKQTANLMCVKGCFESYRLHPFAPWRISRSSLQEYLRELLSGRAPAAVARAHRAMAAITGGSND